MFLNLSKAYRLFFLVWSTLACSSEYLCFLAYIAAILASSSLGSFSSFLKLSSLMLVYEVLVDMEYEALVDIDSILGLS